MADHHRVVVDLLDQIAERQRRLTAEYARPEGHSPKRVADHHQVINLNLKLAEIHAQLALVEAVYDLRLSQ